LKKGGWWESECQMQNRCGFIDEDIEANRYYKRGMAKEIISERPFSSFFLRLKNKHLTLYPSHLTPHAREPDRRDMSNVETRPPLILNESKRKSLNNSPKKGEPTLRDFSR